MRSIAADQPPARLPDPHRPGARSNTLLRGLARLAGDPQCPLRTCVAGHMHLGLKQLHAPPKNTATLLKTRSAHSRSQHH